MLSRVVTAEEKAMTTLVKRWGYTQDFSELPVSFDIMSDFSFLLFCISIIRACISYSDKGNPIIKYFADCELLKCTVVFGVRLYSWNRLGVGGASGTQWLHLGSAKCMTRRQFSQGFWTCLPPIFLAVRRCWELSGLAPGRVRIWWAGS